MNELDHLKSRGYKDYSFGHQLMYKFPIQILMGKKSDILDIGCGVGYGLKWMLEKDVVNSYTGIEPSLECVDYIKENNLIPKFCEILNSSWLDYDGDRFFDFSFCIEVIEHIKEEECLNFLKKIHKHTKRNLFLSTPDSSKNSHGKYTKKEMRNILESAGFSVAVIEWQWTTMYICEVMNQFFFKEQKNSHKGERCFIIASGPSIKNEDLSLLKDEQTIGVNQSYLITQKFGFDPTYMCLADDQLYLRIKDTYKKLNSKICFTDGKFGKVGHTYDCANRIGLVKTKDKDAFSGNFNYLLEEGIYYSHNVVTDIAIPMAMYLGFSEIYLLGCDCNEKGYAYDISKDIGMGQKFGSEVFLAYRSIKKIADKEGFKIINLSKETNLNEFPKDSLLNILSNKNKVGSGCG